MRITIDTDQLTTAEAEALCEGILDAVAASEKIRGSTAYTRALHPELSRGTRPTDTTSTVRERVRNALASSGKPMSMNELIRATWASRQMLYLALSELVQRGLVRKTGNRNSYRWSLVGPGENEVGEEGPA